MDSSWIILDSQEQCKFRMLIWIQSSFEKRVEHVLQILLEVFHVTDLCPKRVKSRQLDHPFHLHQHLNKQLQFKYELHDIDAPSNFESHKHKEILLWMLYVTSDGYNCCCVLQSIIDDITAVVTAAFAEYDHRITHRISL